ncbi:ribosomal protein S3 (mitochondrion) [Marchantia polymorpha subsp. ruderalis]|uniref:Small ribosomal subunit protein uS3m n=5 Tax=Marchantia polymorpha TaxID=3197 RepID=A0A2Z6DTC1_MARPO|nr:ribosomal protein S3 [Marchantia polymorpha subsp. ruderalis]QBE89506.1 ribosomal protein S3 [Marchantia polymorpha subsp. ruderalis]BBD75156.1 ribosomal protein S3 [Marchantia polymorpha subsp. ruderalis]BDD77339.1 ribosomal protein S3 [Marchantia polymorpha subsp. ruderalis]
MAQKVNPISVRLNLNRSSDSSWFSDYYYGKLLYQDLNFRDYFGSIRPPTGNTFGFRLGRCIIHHFPKRTFIHVFFLDRLSQSRHQGLGAIPSVKLIRRINDNTVKQRNEVGIWPKKRYEYHDRLPSIQKIDQLLRVSDWMADIHSTFQSIWPKDENDDRRASEERYAFSRFAPSILVAVRAEKKKEIFGSEGDFFGFTGRAFLDYFVMQYFFNLKNQIQFDPMVNRSPVAQGVAKTSTIEEAIPAKTEQGTQSGESICQLRSTLYFDAIIFLRYARFRKATSLSSRYYYLKKMQSLFSNQTKTNTLIQPVKIASVYQSASLIAQEISWKLEQKKSFRQICRSIFKQIKKCPYVKGIRIGCSGRLNGAEIAKTECKKYGETSLHVFSDQIDYAKTQASTPYGILGVKVWVSYFLTQKKGTSCAISKTYKIS